jgi:hypothetical protein
MNEMVRNDEIIEKLSHRELCSQRLMADDAVAPAAEARASQRIRIGSFADLLSISIYSTD